MKKKALWTLGSLISICFGLFACATSRAGYESAPYTVAQTLEPNAELRDYPVLTVVSTPGKGPNDDGSFMRLFRYIQGDNQTEAKIAMTTPVLMDRKADADHSTTMSFVVPTDVATKGAPAPKAENVAVTSRPAGRYAVLRFTGKQSPENEAAALKQLQAILKAKSITSAGPATFAYYDPPWTPGPLRRNEVLLPVNPK